VVEAIEELPSVTPQQRTGRWIGAEVLDKIRVEIMDFEEELFHKPNTDYSDYSAVRYCVEIIDKYKTESEVQE
jgi:chromosome condensin MukBEF MukE localization factor